MNPTRFIPSRRAPLLAFALCTAALAPAFAQSNRPGWGQPAPASVLPVALRVASEEAQEFSLARLAGKPLHGANNEPLGSVADFLIDPASGRVAYAVVPAGQGPSGETFRLVPIAAIDASTADNPQWTARITRPQWDQVGTIVGGVLGPRVLVNAEQRQRMAAQFSLGRDPAGVDSYIRAFNLRGQQVRSGNQVLGTIEDPVIDLPRQMAAVILKPTGRFVRSDQAFLVPFEKLQVPAEASGAITSTLSPFDFQQARAALSPTGYSDAAFTRGNSRNSRGTPDAAALAVQQALGNSGVQVISESRLVLRGTVADQQRKAEIERAAQQAAPGVRIDNEITVRGW